MTDIKTTAHVLHQLSHHNYRSLKRLGRREITVCPADSSTNLFETRIIKLRIRRDPTTGDLRYEIIHTCTQEQPSDDREISSTRPNL